MKNFQGKLGHTLLTQNFKSCRLGLVRESSATSSSSPSARLRKMLPRAQAQLSMQSAEQASSPSSQAPPRVKRDKLGMRERERHGQWRLASLYSKSFPFTTHRGMFLTVMTLRFSTMITGRARCAKSLRRYGVTLLLERASTRAACAKQRKQLRYWQHRSPLTPPQWLFDHG